MDISASDLSMNSYKTPNLRSREFPWGFQVNARIVACKVTNIKSSSIISVHLPAGYLVRTEF
jgi:hypothetical protein